MGLVKMNGIKIWKKRIKLWKDLGKSNKRIIMKIIDHYLHSPVYSPMRDWLDSKSVKPITPNVDCWYGDVHRLDYKTVEICSECGESSEYNVKHDCEITWKFQSSKIDYLEEITEINEEIDDKKQREYAIEEVFEENEDPDEEEIWKYWNTLTFKCKHCGKLEQHKQHEVIDYSVNYTTLTIDDEIERKMKND